MQLDPKQWFVSWFLFSVDALSIVTGGYVSRARFANGADICTLVHTSWIGALIVALHAGLLYGAYWSLIKVPTSLFGGAGYVYLILSSAAIVVACWLFFGYAVPGIGRWQEDRKNRKRIRRYEKDRLRLEWEVAPAKDPVLRGPGFFAVCREWFLGMKDRYCTKIYWTEPVSTEKAEASKFVLPAGLYAGIVAVMFVIAGMFWLTAEAMTAVKQNLWVASDNVQCVRTSGGLHSGGSAQANLSCGSLSAWTVERETIAHFLTNPQAVVSCKIYEDGEASCSSK